MLQTQSLRKAGQPRGVWSRACLIAGIAILAGFVAQDADARPGGGGFPGGAGISRPSGAGISRTGVSRPQRGTGQQKKFGSRSGAANKDTGANGNSTRQANGNSNTQMASHGSGNTGVAGNTTNASSGVVGSGNGNTGVVNNGNVNNGNVGSGNVNTGTVVAGNDVNVDVDGGWTGYGYTYPAGTGAAYATGVAVGTATTAAVVGSYYSTLPAGCSSYIYGSYRYYTCASTWYQQQYKSGSTVYVVISDPTK